MNDTLIQNLHRQACVDKEDNYQDPESGYLVATEHYHLKRGTCCQNNCRHCPYPVSGRK